MHFKEEAEPEDLGQALASLGLGSSGLLNNSAVAAPWGWMSCPELLKALDVVGLSWLTRLCNIVWSSGTVPLEWQTGVVVPLFKKGDQRVCSYRGLKLLSLPRKV